MLAAAVNYTSDQRDGSAHDMALSFELRALFSIRCFVHYELVLISVSKYMFCVQDPLLLFAPGVLQQLNGRAPWAAVGVGVAMGISLVPCLALSRTFTSAA